VEVALLRVHVGDRLRVRPARRSGRGICLEGSSNVDESMVTGGRFRCEEPATG